MLLDIYPKQEILTSVFPSIRCSNDGKNLIGQTEIENRTVEGNPLYSIEFVPGYFKIDMFDNKVFRRKIFNSKKGYSICLDGFTSVDNYLKKQFSNKGKPIKRSVRRLENCLDISYKMYYGEISRDNYNFLFGLLKEMIEKRFRQRNEKSHNLGSWDSLFKTGYDLINEKKASLFVIYHRDNPIEISFNYHYNRILFSYVSSYSIDYYKFSLGQIEIYKQLEWCFLNKYQYFEMGWGDLEYKRKWSNNIYTFEHHLVFKKNSIPAYLYVLFEGNKTRLIAYLLAKKINVPYNKVKGLFKRKQATAHNAQKVKLENIEDGNIMNGHSPVTFPDNSTTFLKASFNSFLYTTQEYYADVQLYHPIENQYIIQGENHYQKVILIP